MSVESWLLFCLTETVLCFTPGPAVLLVLSLSLTRGASSGFRASVGILSATAMYFVISATSLGALILASWELFTVIKWLGAAYLIWRGVRMIVSSKRALVPSRVDSGSTRGKAPLGSFPYGFLTQGANPKALVFFTAILPQFINPQRAIGVQLTILGVSSIVIELVVLSIYVAACHRTRGFAQHARFAAPLERVGGALLIGAGVRLATTHRG
jgi:homoserine/homoserine lactone efflux protein